MKQVKIFYSGFYPGKGTLENAVNAFCSVVDVVDIKLAEGGGGITTIMVIYELLEDKEEAEEEEEVVL